MENYLPEWGLQILNKTFFGEMYILCFGFKKTLLKIKNSTCQPKYTRCEIRVEMQNRLFK